MGKKFLGLVLAAAMAITPATGGLTVFADSDGADDITITAPAGSRIQAGCQLDYYRYTWFEPTSQTTLSDGSVQSTFELNSGTNTFYRVSNDDGVTYTNFVSMSADADYTVTESDLKMDDSTFNSDTIYHNFEKNVLDIGDIYLNINERNYLSMEAGGTYELNCFRNWFAVESYTNSKVALPDMHYEVCDINGNASSLLTVEQDENNPCVATLKAGEGTGLAIVKVTYDAMTHMQGYSYTGSTDSTRFSAIWPESTGIIVVTVGQDGSGIDMGMTINEETTAGKVAGTKLDAEHDPIFYVGDEGASYTFSPESGTTVAIARSTVGTKELSYSGFSTDGITTDSDGNVTISGLKTGRHIIRVTKDGLSNYQVITVRQAQLTLKDESGNTYDANHKFNPGDKVTITLTGLTSPGEKLSGYYNNNFYIKYFAQDDLETSLTDWKGINIGVYNFSSLSHSVTVTIPTDWTGSTYSLINGAIGVAGMSGGAFGSHRSCTYAAGKGASSGDTATGVLGGLPDIAIQVAQETDTAPHLASGQAATESASITTMDTYTKDLSTVFVDDESDALTYSVSVNGGAYESCSAQYAYTPDASGTVELKFKANDGQYDSTATFTATLTISQALNVSSGIKVSDTSCGYYNVGELVKFDTVEEYTQEDCLPAYVVTLPAEQTFNIVEDSTLVEGSTDRTLEDINGNPYAISPTAISTTLRSMTIVPQDEMLDTFGNILDSNFIGPREFYEDSGIDDNEQVLALKIYGAVEGSVDEWYEWGMDPAYVIIVRFDSTKKPSTTSHMLKSVAAKAATCTEKGNAQYWNCTVCGKYFTDSAAKNETTLEALEIPATGHKWDSGTITTKPTFASDGVRTFTCLNNSEHTKTEAVTKLGFDITYNGTAITNITYDKTYDASYADWQTGEKVEQIIPLATVKVPACPDSDVDIALNATRSEYLTYYYTRTPGSSGYNEYVDYGFGDESGGMKVAAAGKSYTTKAYEDNVILVQTTYDSDFNSETLYAIAFDFEQEHDWKTVFTSEADCENSGITVKQCQNNPLEIIVETTEALGHDWDDGTVTQKPTFDAEGVMTYTCSRNAEHIRMEAIDKKTLTTAKVDFTSQLSGGFLHAPQTDYEVSSDLAESYGYTDDVNDGVSALDVLVAAHSLVYGEDFTKDTATNYLIVTDNNVERQFGVDKVDGLFVESYAGMFFVNHAFPNDGTTYTTGSITAYKGTTVGTQKVQNGDLVEFFFSESAFLADTYNWFLDEDGNYARQFDADCSGSITLKLKGFYAVNADRCKDEKELVNYQGASAQADVQIYTVNVETGALSAIEDAITDDDGNVTLSFEKPGTYTITAYGKDEYGMAVQIMSLTTIEVGDHTLQKHDAVAAACETQGSIEYWSCSGCGRLFADAAAMEEIDEADIPIAATGHKFKDYTYNKDANYLADGTETATCTADGCTKTQTRTATGTRLIDSAAPTGSIIVGENIWKTFTGRVLDNIYSKDGFEVEIKAEDAESGLASAEYLISDTALTETSITSATGWKTYAPFEITGEGTHIVYAKLTDNSGNIAYIGTDGLCVDSIAPKISGVVDGGTYCNEAEFTVSGAYLDTVTVDGRRELPYNGKYTLSPASGAQEIVATDKAGNSTAISVTVNDGHTFTDYVSNNDATYLADGTKTAKCDYCDATQTITDEGSAKAKTDIEKFVARLYNVTLDREPDEEGFNNFVNNLESKTTSGTQAAYEFIFSEEFKAKNYCNGHYVEYLYKAMLGHDADSVGKAEWVAKLDAGTTREEVFNGFAQSMEFKGLCYSAGIEPGDAIPIPEYGTMPTGPCSVDWCGEYDGVIGFVLRLYEVCLGRSAQNNEQADWVNMLRTHENTGGSTADGFFNSDEYLKKGTSDEQYVDDLYTAYFDREGDDAGKQSWLEALASGKTRDEVRDGFSQSKEFADLCAEYGIIA